MPFPHDRGQLRHAVHLGSSNGEEILGARATRTTQNRVQLSNGRRPAIWQTIATPGAGLMSH